MGPTAKSAVPALLALHKTANKVEHVSLRADIENALRKINPPSAKKLGIE